MGEKANGAGKLIGISEKIKIKQLNDQIHLYIPHYYNYQHL